MVKKVKAIERAVNVLKENALQAEARIIVAKSSLLQSKNRLFT